MNYGHRVSCEIDAVNYRAVATYKIDDYEKLTQDEFKQMCNCSAINKARSLYKMLIHQIFKSPTCIGGDECMEYSVQINAFSGNYRVHVKLTDDTIVKIKSMFRDSNRLSDNEDDRYKEIRDKVDELYNTYLDKLLSIADISWAFFDKNHLCRSELVHDAVCHGIETVKHKIANEIEAYTVNIENVYHIGRDTAITFIDGRLKKYSVGQFIKEFKTSLFVDVCGVGRYTPIDKAGYYIKGIKQFSKLYYSQTTPGISNQIYTGNYHKLYKYHYKSVGYKITRDRAGKPVIIPINTYFNINSTLMHSLNDGMTLDNFYTALNIANNNLKEKMNNRKNELATIKQEVESRGINKKYCTKFDIFAIETLEKAEATDIAEVIQFVYKVHNIETYKSNLATDLKMDCSYDTIRIQFGLNNIAVSREQTKGFIITHINSINILAKAIMVDEVTNMRKKGQDIPIGFFNMSCKLAGPSILEYVFTLKNGLYSMAESSNNIQK